jgi:hypothetical protein
MKPPDSDAVAFSCLYGTGAYRSQTPGQLTFGPYSLRHIMNARVTPAPVASLDA